MASQDDSDDEAFDSPHPSVIDEVVAAEPHHARRPESRYFHGDNPESSVKWNSPAGWSVYFPEDPEDQPASADRALAVAHLRAFFLSEHGQVPLLGISTTSFALPLDFRRMTHTSTHPAVRGVAGELASNPEVALATIGLAACRAWENIVASDPQSAPPLNLFVDSADRLLPRVYNFSPLTPLRDLRSTIVGRFVSVRGTVVRVSAIRQQLVSMEFECGRCSETQLVNFPDYRYILPTSCPADKCRSRTFQPLRSTAETVDWQRIRIQEIQQRDNDASSFEEGRIPRTIDAEIFEDLIDSTIPGDIAVISGVVKVLTINSPGLHRNAKCLYYMYIEANSITTTSSRKKVMENGNSVHQALDQMSSSVVQRVVGEVLAEKDPFGFLVHSAVPSIYGHEIVKAGLLLSLFGGSPKEKMGPAGMEPVSVRRDIHCLVVGDPGLGKSQMLKAMCSVAPRGVYVCGNTTSTAGLTVTVVREASGDFALEAGALVLADGGVCCIDEFDKMGAEHGALLEAMEQQSVSVAKAGLVCNLSARTTVLAAANPVGGHYDRSRTVCENLKISLPLLSRFDLVFILMDKADAARDKFISEHVMQMFGLRRESRPPANGWRGSERCFEQANTATAGTQRGATQAALVTQGTTLVADAAEVVESESLEKRLQNMKVRDPLPPKLFREYITYARENVKPRLSEGAKRVLQDFYVKLRKAAQTQAADTTPITTRQLESMIRLSEARARAVMREEVTAGDARDVVEIIHECMVAEVTDGVGEIDLGRASGMSRSKEAKRFIDAVSAEASRVRSALFDRSTLKRIAEGIGISADRFDRMLETVNTQGFLIQKGGRKYELTGSNFEGEQAPPPERRARRRTPQPSSFQPTSQVLQRTSQRMTSQGRRGVPTSGVSSHRADENWTQNGTQSVQGTQWGAPSQNEIGQGGGEPPGNRPVQQGAQSSPWVRQPRQGYSGRFVEDSDAEND